MLDWEHMEQIQQMTANMAGTMAEIQAKMVTMGPAKTVMVMNKLMASLTTEQILLMEETIREVEEAEEAAMEVEVLPAWQDRKWTPTQMLDEARKAEAKAAEWTEKATEAREEEVAAETAYAWQRLAMEVAAETGSLTPTQMADAARKAKAKAAEHTKRATTACKNVLELMLKKFGVASWSTKDVCLAMNSLQDATATGAVKALVLMGESSWYHGEDPEANEDLLYALKQANRMLNDVRVLRCRAQCRDPTDREELLRVALIAHHEASAPFDEEEQAAFLSGYFKAGGVNHKLGWFFQSIRAIDTARRVKSRRPNGKSRGLKKSKEDYMTDEPVNIGEWLSEPVFTDVVGEFNCLSVFPCVLQQQQQLNCDFSSSTVMNV